MQSLQFGAINWLAVVVSALATFFLGGLWYTALFGKAWQKLQGFTDEQLRQLKAKTPPPVFFGVMFVSYFVLAIVLALILPMTHAQNGAQGALLGFLLWVGPAATIKMTDHIATGKAFGVFLIDSSFQLIYLVMMCAIIAAWH